MKRKSLPTVRCSEEVWNKILESTLRHVEVDSLADYCCGYGNRDVVYYTSGSDSDMLIVEAYLLFYVLNMPYDYRRGWVQYLVIKDCEQKEPVIERATTPIDALKAVSHELRSKYTDEEIEEVYDAHKATKIEAEILHYNILYGAGLSQGVIYKFSDCVYYDLNGAYASALTDMFPKCSEKFKYWFEHRHDDHNRFKNYFNYFVGCMTQSKKKMKDGKPTRKIHPESRFWIVKRITDKMYYGLKRSGFRLKEDAIYVNTDGLIVQKPKYRLNTSGEMNDFKLEYEGDVYMLRTKNGWVMQYGDEIKGNVPLSLRPKIDLKSGDSVEYDLEITKDGIRKPINIKEKHYETIEVR